LNIERDQEGGKVLSPHVVHGYVGNELTCTNRLTRQWDSKLKTIQDETIDYISLFNGSQAVLESGHLVKAYDQTYNTKTALSDHHGLAVVVVRNWKLQP
jgi:hypothetical protein